jgi:hypothetical protein
LTLYLPSFVNDTGLVIVIISKYPYEFLYPDKFFLGGIGAWHGISSRLSAISGKAPAGSASIAPAPIRSGLLSTL